MVHGLQWVQHLDDDWLVTNMFMYFAQSVRGINRAAPAQRAARRAMPMNSTINTVIPLHVVINIPLHIVTLMAVNNDMQGNTSTALQGSIRVSTS